MYKFLMLRSSHVSNRTSSLAQMLTIDTSGIELYVTENNP